MRVILACLEIVSITTLSLALPISNHTTSPAAENNDPQCSCDNVECPNATDCPNGVTTDACGCCLLCLRGRGELCGGDRDKFGICSSGLECFDLNSVNGGYCIRSSNHPSTCVKRSGRVFAHGVNFVDSSACQSCHCLDGRLTCKEISCPKLECDTLVQDEGACCPRCAINETCLDQRTGYSYKLHEEWAVGCEKCECIGNGRITCSPTSCPTLDCNLELRPLDSCCPICVDNPIAALHDSDHAGTSEAIFNIEFCTDIDGRSHKTGEVWQSGCTLFECMPSESGENFIDIRPVDCPELHCASRILSSGACCETCYVEEH